MSFNARRLDHNIITGARAPPAQENVEFRFSQIAR